MSDLAAIAAALPQYELGRELGKGGFGVVLQGTHRTLGRKVAIKQLLSGVVSDPKARARFEAEAKVMASFAHPHIVPIYDYVERDGMCLLVMENMPNGTVWGHFNQRGFAMPSTCVIVMVTCAALHYAHKHGVLHRDIKAENLLFGEDGSLKVADFGIAKVIGGGDVLATQAGDILGTPAYMAPEQCEGKELGPQADVYATGVLMYELLSGKLPYSSEGGGLAILYRKVYEEPIPLLSVAPNVPPPLAEVCMRAIERDVTARFQTAEEFGIAVAEVATGLWGPGWTSQAELAMISAGPILAATERPSGQFTAGGSPAAAAPGLETAGGTPIPVAPAPVTAVQAQDAHIGQAQLGSAGGIDLSPVQKLLEVPPPPVAQGIVALVLLGLTGMLSLIGLGNADREPVAKPEMSATINGQPITGGELVELDLKNPLVVKVDPTVASNEGLGAATQAQLALSVGGQPIGTSNKGDITLGGTPAAPADPANPAAAPGTPGETELKAGGSRFLLGGEATGELRFLDAAGATINGEGYRFAVKPKQSSFLTIPGVLSVVLLLLTIAYSESLLRPMRRGRKKVSGTAGLGVVGAFFGAAVAILGWVLGFGELAIPTLIACAVTGAGTGIAAGLAAAVIGKRNRVKRATQRATIIATQAATGVYGQVGGPTQRL